nr:protein CREG1-like [Halyomorpha halys]
MKGLIYTILGLFSFGSSDLLYNKYRDIPPRDDVARMARYIVHTADWCVLSHITHQRNATGYPMGRVFSMSDGPVGKSSGTPYIYTSFFDAFARDLKLDGKCAITTSLVQTGYCKDHDIDPENPLCAQVMLIGDYEFIKNNTEEWTLAKEALFSRHPEMKDWPASHGFTFGKLNIKNVQIVDYFGGSKYPTVPEYYNVTLTPSRKSFPKINYNVIPMENIKKAYFN